MTSCEIQLYPTRTINPSLDLLSARPITVESNRATNMCCASARILAESTYIEVQHPYVQRAETAVSDSDDKGPPGTEISSVFSDSELYLLRFPFSECVWKTLFYGILQVSSASPRMSR